MKTYNHLFSSLKRFEDFLNTHNLQKDKKYFTQIFIGDNNLKKLSLILHQIDELLPYSSTIASSTAGEIIEGGMQDNSVVISISKFEATEVKTALIEGNTEEDIVTTIISSMVTDKTKLILAFNNLYANDGELFLKNLQKRLPHIKVAGGNAGDNGEFKLQTIVGEGKKVSTTAIAVAVFDSDILQVFSDYLFNWQTIGEPMLITKANGNTIYEINKQSAQDVYKNYLGEEVASALPLSGVEFPLIFKEDNIEIARSPIAIGSNGEIIMGGHIAEGTTVKFGFGDVTQNDIDASQLMQIFSQQPIESIFIYSCSARKYFLKEHLNNEFEMLQQIAPTSGFITYGEFFHHDKCNTMLNVSSSFVGLSETLNINKKLDFKTKYKTSSMRTLHALTHLVKKTSLHVEEKKNKLNQFRKLIKEATLYSATDTQGIIVDVNDRFVKLSGYSKEELIGQKHNIVRHPDVSPKIYQEMWSNLHAKKSWKGILKNKNKNGSEYYVKSHIFPMLDLKGKIIKFISLRDDITQEMKRKEFLKGSLNSLQKKSDGQEYLITQYEKIINLSNSFFKVDANFKILHVNEVFCTLYSSAMDKIVQTNIVDIIDPNFLHNDFHSIHEIILQKGTWYGVIPFMRKDKTLFYMNASVNTIYNQENILIEYMIVMHDITDLIVAQQEIEDIQKDVVYTMGAIGESRSKETGNHVKRVAEYSKLFALHYGLNKKKAELLKMASPMHDIGKVGIPDSILNKPAKLTKDEWKIMKTHSALGYAMLRRSKRKILKTAAIVAYTHHEKWDGSGYPKGLQGEEIHIFGRITAIADVFDALGSDRCYKKAWKDEDVFELIKNGRGTHFEPKLVDIFFDNLEDFLKVRDKFQD